MKPFITSVAFLSLLACGTDSESVERYGVEAQHEIEAPANEPVNPYVAAAEERWHELGEQVDELRARVLEQGEEASAKFAELMGRLEDKREAVGDELIALRESTQEAWAATSDKVHGLLNDLESSLDDAFEQIGG